MDRAKNQWTAKMTPEDFITDFLEHRVMSIAGVHSIYKCMKPIGAGVHANAGGYYRTSFNGVTITLHKFIHEARAGISRDGDDVSHLCGKEWCVNPDHLYYERRDKNLSRRGCAGVVHVDSSKWVLVCKHEPRCKVVSTGQTCPKPE